jgi:hypothetical protein
VGELLQALLTDSSAYLHMQQQTEPLILQAKGALSHTWEALKNYFVPNSPIC